MNDLSMDSDQELLELQQSYIRGIPEKIAALQNLWNRLRSTSWKPEDIVDLYTLIHNLRGSGAIFGLEAISDESKPLERLIAGLKEKSQPPTDEDHRHFVTGMDNLKNVAAKTIEPLHVEVQPPEAQHSHSAAELVLIVDDDHEIRRWTLEFLKKSYRTAEATNGEDGLLKALELFPDLIISDVVMPKMDGYRFCHAIKSDERLNKIPVILLTAEASEDHKVAGLEYGADDYVTKPFSMRELLARVKNLIKLKQTQSQMIHSAKMAALGQLVSGAAHELNNPLAVVLGNLGFLEEHVKSLVELLSHYNQNGNEKGSPTTHQKSAIDKIKSKAGFDHLIKDIGDELKGCQQGAQRIKTIVSALMTFSHHDRGDWKEMDLRESIETTLTLFLSQYDRIVIVDTQFAETPKVDCLVGQVNQVLMSLLINAAQAIESRNETEGRSKGHIWINTQMAESGAVGERRIVKISIRDDGHGIPLEIRDQVFNPFFTTRPIGMAPGLGLSTSHTIIANHKGKLYFNSEPGKGTEFIIELPI